MKQLRTRILGFFFLLFTVFSVFILYIFSNILTERSMEIQEESLQSQLLTLSSSITSGYTFQEQGSDIEFQLEKTALNIEERITLIDLDGEVLFDSEVDSNTLDNHFERPEFQQVINGETVGSYNRISESTGEGQYYAATFLNESNGEAFAVLRLSKSVDDMVGSTDQLVQALLLFTGISIMATLLFAHYWTKKIGAPIENIKQVANRLSYQEYSSRYTSSSYKEINDLGEAVNELAVNLDAQMYEIRQNDKRLRELINHLVIGVMLLDENRKMTMVNPVMNEILGINLYGKIGHEYTESTKSSILADLIEKAYKKEEPQNKEITFYFQDEKMVDANVVPIPGRTLGTVNFIVLLYDITEIRRLEKVRTDFVANASHELRTPITALKGFSETLLDGAMYDEEVLVEFLKIMYKESSRLDSMIHDVLQLSKLEQKQVQINTEIVNIKETVEEVFQILHQKAELKQISFSIEDVSSVEISVDKDQFKQILLNLVGNAISYTPENGKVDVIIDAYSDEVRIQVKDTGIGIPKAEQTRIFERFYRVDKARSRNAGGTGLGLSIVKWLVENLNGRIELESRVDIGSTFTVWIPQKQD